MLALDSPTDSMTAGLIAGFVVSTVGLGMFVYGRKQRRAPQMAGGLILMVLPLTGASGLVIWLSGLAVVAAITAAVRMGW
ncbi:MAG: hypothetical protein IPM29_04330 [Planctomycetes bacterium]|nr:hypothetical protein [Planctomycetota bacterium]